MIAIDTSSWGAYLAGESGRDVDSAEDALAQGIAVLPPPVLAELLSNPKLPSQVGAMFRALPLLHLSEGYWERVGVVRGKVLARGLRARLADSLIAQSCIDHGVALITRDADFRHFVKHGLRLIA